MTICRGNEVLGLLGCAGGTGANPESVCERSGEPLHPIPMIHKGLLAATQLACVLDLCGLRKETLAPNVTSDWANDQETNPGQAGRRATPAHLEEALEQPLNAWGLSC